MKPMTRFPRPRSLCSWAILLTLLPPLQALAAPLMADPAALDRRLGALIAGRYPSAQCSPLPDREGLPATAGVLVIGADAGLEMRGERMSGLDGIAEFGLGRHLGKENRFHVEWLDGASRHAMLSSESETPLLGFMEVGVSPGGRGNVSEGQLCQELDMRSLPLMAPANPLLRLMTEAYDTGGRTVALSCRNLGAKRGGKRVGGETRSASYRLGPDAVVLNGETIPFADASRPLQYLVLGGRRADGVLNASFDWADGHNLHIEQAVGEVLEVMQVGFTEGEAVWHCTPTSR